MSKATTTTTTTSTPPVVPSSTTTMATTSTLRKQTRFFCRATQCMRGLCYDHFLRISVCPSVTVKTAENIIELITGKLPSF